VRVKLPEQLTDEERKHIEELRAIRDGVRAGAGSEGRA
jgi:hypothetical protein